MKSDSKACCYDGLPCDRFIDACDFGACYTKSLEGKLLSVCPRFRVSSSIPLVEDLVHWELISK